MNPESQRQQLMACLALCDSLFRRARPWFSKLQNSEQDEAGFNLWVSALESYFEQWEKLPDLNTLIQLAGPMRGKADYESSLVIDRDCAAAATLVSSWSATADQEELFRVGIDLFAEYSKVRIGMRAVRALESRPDSGHLEADRLRGDYISLEALNGSIFESNFPEGDVPAMPDDVYQPVGIPFVDSLCGGGLISGEVVGHCAPIGQGKTTLILQLIWARASRVFAWEAKKAKEENRAVVWKGLPYIYFFAFESVRTLMATFVSNAANIPRNTALELTLRGKNRSGLSSAARRDYKEYEVKLFAQQLEKAARGEAKWPAGELERFEHVVKVSDACIRLVDFSGHDEKLLEWSQRGVNGMRDYLDAHQSAIGRPGVNFVALDHVSAMTDTLVGSGVLKDSDKTSFIKRTPNTLSRMIGNAFSCPVWAAHQLSPDENIKAPGSVPNPVGSSGSKMFLEYCSVGFASGMLSRESIAAFKLGKQRRLSTAEADIYLGRLDKHCARWIRADDYVIANGAIMPRNELGGSKLPPGARSKIPISGSFEDDFA